MTVAYPPQYTERGHRRPYSGAPGGAARDLPVQEPTKLSLIINLEVAKALGLSASDRFRDRTLIGARSGASPCLQDARAFNTRHGYGTNTTERKTVMDAWQKPGVKCS